jgi:DNA-binding MarR family transcriptional regulator
MDKRVPACKPEAPLDLDEFLCFSVYAANHAFNRIYHPMLREIDLTYPQFIAMILLWEKDGQTVGEIGERLYLQSNTLTPMLKRLEVLGYIERIRDPLDERQVRIKITASGRKLRQRAFEIVQRVRSATGLADKKMKSLVGQVATLRKSLEEKLPE